MDEAYVKGGEFLRAIGMENQAEIARVLDVAMNPNSLFVSFQDPKRARNTNVRVLKMILILMYPPLVLLSASNGMLVLGKRKKSNSDPIPPILGSL